MAAQLELDDKNPAPLMDRDKRENIDYLFNTNLYYDHHRKLFDQDIKNNDNDNDISFKQNKVEEIINNHLSENEANMNAEQILHSKIMQHNHKDDRPNYNMKAMHHHGTNEDVRVQSQSFLFVLLTVIGCQLLIWYWRKKHMRSFFIVTLFGLWLFPIIISVQLRYWRMIIIWSIFTMIFGLLLNMSRQKPMNRKTPRYLYSWFYFLYRLTNILSIIGYILFLADFFGLGILIFGPHPREEKEYRNKLLHHQHEAHLHAVHGDSDIDTVKQEMLNERDELSQLSHGYHHIHFSDIGIYLLFYGLYYGVLARDTAQLCADWISSALGFFNPSGFPRRRVPTNICAVCNNLLIDHDIGLFDINDDDDDRKDDIMRHRESTTDRRMKLMKQRRRMDEKQAAAQKKEAIPCNPFNLCSLSNSKQDEEIEINCKHRFHGFCIRGWIMIGKRDVCPVCKEKVNLKGIFANPWQKQDRMWSQLLDGVRYLMVWNPVIVLAANLVFTASGLSFNGKKTQPPINMAAI